MVDLKKNIKGTIQEKTNNSVKINNYWIKFFESELIKDVQMGDVVEIIYQDNTKNGKTYHNGKEIKRIKYDDVKLTSNTELSNQTQNTILMIVKDILVKEIDLGHTFTLKEFEEKAKHITKLFKECYEELK